MLPLALITFPLIIISHANAKSNTVDSEDDLLKPPKENPSKGSLKIFGTIPEFSLKLEPKSNDSSEFETEYRPATKFDVGFSVFSSGFFLTLGGFRLPAGEETKRTYGDTSYDYFRFGHAWQQLVVDAGYQRYKGFFVYNSKIDTDYGIYEKRPDLRVTSWFANATWVSRCNQFRIQNVLDNSGEPVETGWSPLVVATFDTTKIASNNSLIPPAHKAVYAKDADFKSGTFDTLSLKGGFAGSYTFSKYWYVAGLMAVGFGYQSRSYVRNEETIHSSGLGTSAATFAAAFGRTGEKWYGGSTARFFQNGVELGDVTVNMTTSEAELFIGKKLQELSFEEVFDF